MTKERMTDDATNHERALRADIDQVSGGSVKFRMERHLEALLQAKDAEIARLSKERDEYRTKMLSEGGKFLKEMQRADLLKDEVAALRAELERLTQDRDEWQRRALERDLEVTQLRADLDRLKPSGPVAEDVAFVEECVGVSSDHWSRHRTERARSTISRLATQAQSAQVLAETLAKAGHMLQGVGFDHRNEVYAEIVAALRLAKRLP
jgi:hypothetical protein